MSDVLYLAWRYLAYHRLKTVVLVMSIAAIVYLPLGLNILLDQSAQQLRGRAESTPLLIGAKGSPLELALRSLYFESSVPAAIPFAQVERVADTDLAMAIPIYARYQSRHGPIVGTSLSYFDFRGLSIDDGRLMAMLGECVIGSELARQQNLVVGDYVVSATESVFDIAGVYPLKMKIVGVLSPNDSPDDQAVFVDVKTTWIIEGIGHGHQDLSRPEASGNVLRKEGDKIVANASVVEYNELTADNVAGFHFHGDKANFPVTSIIAVPKSPKANALLQGRYLSDDEEVQIIRPIDVMEDLLGTVFAVGRYLTAAILIVGLTTLATMTLVFMLSLQLRRRELETIAKIGGSRLRIVSIVGAEVLGVLGFGTLLAVMMAIATSWFAAAATRLLVQIS